MYPFQQQQQQQQRVSLSRKPIYVHVSVWITLASLRWNPPQPPYSTHPNLVNPRRTLAMHKRVICCRKVSVCPSVLYKATRNTSKSQTFHSAHSTLFCYSGQSQIMQVISAAYIRF